MADNGGLYLSPDFSDFGDQGAAEIAALIEHYAGASPDAKVFVACGSMGGELCWELAGNGAIAKRLSGLLLLGSRWDRRATSRARPHSRRRCRSFSAMAAMTPCSPSTSRRPSIGRCTRQGRLPRALRALRDRHAWHADPHERLARHAQLDAVAVALSGGRQEAVARAARGLASEPPDPYLGRDDSSGNRPQAPATEWTVLPLRMNRLCFRQRRNTAPTTTICARSSICACIPPIRCSKGRCRSRRSSPRRSGDQRAGDRRHRHQQSVRRARICPEGGRRRASSRSSAASSISTFGDEREDGARAASAAARPELFAGGADRRRPRPATAIWCGWSAAPISTTPPGEPSHLPVASLDGARRRASSA